MKKEFTKLKTKCSLCDYKVEIPITEDEYVRYSVNNESIQNVLPHVNSNDRELFISGMCGKCFDERLLLSSNKKEQGDSNKMMNENYKVDNALNFFQVLYLKKYLNGHKGYIAGGCFKNIFKKQPVKDIDIFFENEKEFNEAKDLFDKNEDYMEIYSNDNAIGYHDIKNKISIDLVKSQFSTPLRMINTFDFTITKFALYNEEVIQDNNDEIESELKVVYHQDFFEHLTLNRLVIDGDFIHFPLNTFDRMLRYAKYGYAPCIGTKTKIVRTLNETTLPPTDENLFKGFYVGID